jgi:DNA ligase (NAD+)
MKELVALLNAASESYYQKDSTIISDFEYDKLYDELTALEAETGIVLADSPTQKVGYTVLGSLKKVRHESRMLSLDKTKEVERLKSFLGDNTGILSYKMDGLTVVLTYRSGELNQAVTRGNGEVGEDITHNAKCFKNIPLKIPFEGELVIRGEAVISFKEFERINDELAADEAEQYKNPRNLCSGTVRQLDSSIAAKRNVSFIAFALVSAEGKIFGDLREERFEFLDKLGFETVIRKTVNAQSIEADVSEFEKGIENNAFATDGLVLCYSSISYSESLGTTAKFPKDSIAFKWRDELAQTTLREIEWNTSRTGLINPIAVFDSVELEGTTVSRASLHNVSIVEGLQLGIGDTITVYKANMIIPQVAENLTKSGNVVIPDKCPVCNEETEIIVLKDGKALKCTNPNCKAQRISSLAHFVSRDAMNIEGLSEATIEKFIESGFLDNYTDIFKLDRYKEEITAMDGFGEKSYTKLISAINKAETVRLPNFIFALGINHVGLSNAKLLCAYYGNDLSKIMSAKAEELIEIEGFGEVIAQAIERYFSYADNVELINKALEYLTFEQPEEISDTLKLDSLSFVVTGDVYTYKNRKELQADIERLGGKVTGSVSSKTNYLINNDINSVSSKNKKAKELGIPIITEQQFIDMINDGAELN